MENAPIKLEPLPLYVNPTTEVNLPGLVMSNSLLHRQGFCPLRGCEPQLAPGEVAESHNETRASIVPVNMGPPRITLIDLDGGEAEVRSSLLSSGH
jgi:hypothetical protein